MEKLDIETSDLDIRRLDINSKSFSYSLFFTDPFGFSNFLGTVVFHKKEDGSLYLRQIFMISSHRKKHYGSFLIREACKRAFEQEKPGFIYLVAVPQEKALTQWELNKFYSDNGFTMSKMMRYPSQIKYEFTIKDEHKDLLA